MKEHYQRYDKCLLWPFMSKNTSLVTVTECGDSEVEGIVANLSFPTEYRPSDWALPSIAYSCFSPFLSEMSCNTCLQQLLYTTIFQWRYSHVMRSARLAGMHHCHWSWMFMLEQPPIPVYSADSAQKGQKLVKLYQSVFVLSILTHRSIRCASQNTETVIQMFQQPTAAFISK